MKASTGEENKNICPNCEGRVAEDRKGRGYVRHINYGNLPYCDFEKGMRD